VNPNNSDIVYAAAELSSWVWNQGQPRSGREFDMTGGVVYKTTDGGESWTEIWRGDNLARYIWIDPRDTDVLYISTGIFDAKLRTPIHKLVNLAAKAYSSPLMAAKRGPHKQWFWYLYVGSLFMHPTNPDICWLALATTSIIRATAYIFQGWRRDLEACAQRTEHRGG